MVQARNGKKKKTEELVGEPYLLCKLMKYFF